MKGCRWHGPESSARNGRNWRSWENPCSTSRPQPAGICVRGAFDDERLEVTFANYVQVSDIKIAPLLMLPFVENCFKHGNKVNRGWIHLELSLIDDVLTFKVENNKAEIMEDGIQSGIGLDNVAKRLEHEYRGRHDLQIFDTADTFLVVLQLSLTANLVKKRITEEVD